MEEGVEGVIAQCMGDGILRNCLRADLDVPEFVHMVVSSEQNDKCLSRVSVGLDLLEKQIREVVLQNEQSLFGVVERISTIEENVTNVRARVGSLNESLSSLNNDVIEPVNSLAVLLRTARNLQRSIELLRSISRVLSSVEKIRNDTDFPRIAQRTSETLGLLRMTDFTGVAVIDECIPFINETKEKVLSVGGSLLISGLEKRIQTDVGTALQIFFNMKCLSQRLTQVVAGRVGALSSSIKNLLNGPHVVDTASFRKVFMGGLEDVVNEIASSGEQMAHLESVLRKKRDAATLTRFIVVISSDMNSDIVKSFCSTVIGMLSSQLVSSTGKNRVVRLVITNEFPFILSLLRGMERRLKSFLKDIDLAVHLPALPPLFEIRNGYLASMQSRLIESVNRIFVVTEGDRQILTPPTPVQTSRFVALIVGDLNAVQFDAFLTVDVLRACVVKALQLVVLKAEGLVSTGGDARKATGSQVQQRNIALAQSLLEIVKSIGSVELEGKEPAVILSNSIQPIFSFVDSRILSPLWGSASSTVEHVIASIPESDVFTSNAPVMAHRRTSSNPQALQPALTPSSRDAEPRAGDVPPLLTPPLSPRTGVSDFFASADRVSPYMKQLTSIVEALQKNVVQRLSSSAPDTIDSYAVPFLDQMVNSYVRVVEPLCKSGQEAALLQVARDIAQLQLLSSVLVQQRTVDLSGLVAFRSEVIERLEEFSQEQVK